MMLSRYDGDAVGICNSGQWRNERGCKGGERLCEFGGSVCNRQCVSTMCLNPENGGRMLTVGQRTTLVGMQSGIIIL